MGVIVKEEEGKKKKHIFFQWWSVTYATLKMARIITCLLIAFTFGLSAAALLSRSPRLENIATKAGSKDMPAVEDLRQFLLILSIFFWVFTIWAGLAWAYEAWMHYKFFKFYLKLDVGSEEDYYTTRYNLFLSKHGFSLTNQPYYSKGNAHKEFKSMLLRQVAKKEKSILKKKNKLN